MIFSLSACGENIGNNASPINAQTAAEAKKLAKTPAYSYPLTSEYAGAGASSQKSAVEAWITGFNLIQPNAQISYDPSGSGAGVNTFLTGATIWAGSDAALQPQQIAQSKAVCEGKTAFDIPVYISPIAVTYNLKDYGLDGKNTHINMSPDLIAKIFSGKVTKWNAPEIKAENPKLASKLPDLPITPIWRSDKSGTTKTFEKYLHAADPKLWPTEPVETWPYSGIGEGAQGTSGVIQTISQAQGTIGYADAAQALGYGTVAVKVGNAYVPYSAAAAARTLDSSPRDTTADQANRVVLKVNYATQNPTDYPIVLVSYDVACPVYKSKQNAEFVRQWLTYVVSPEGQDLAASIAGSAPISDSLRAQVMRSIDVIKEGK